MAKDNLKQIWIRDSTKQLLQVMREHPKESHNDIILRIIMTQRNPKKIKPTT